MKPYNDIAYTAKKSAMRMVNRWRVYVYKKCVPNCTQFGTHFLYTADNQYYWWTRRGSNPRPNKETASFLHAYHRLMFSSAKKTCATDSHLSLKSKVHHSCKAHYD